MRRLEHSPEQLQSHDRPIDCSRPIHRGHHCTNWSLPATRRKVMQAPEYIAMKRTPSSAIQHVPLCKRALMLTLSLGLLLCVAFACVLAASNSAPTSHEPSSLGYIFNSQARLPWKTRHPRRSNFSQQKSNVHQIENRQEQQRLRDLIAKTSALRQHFPKSAKAVQSPRGFYLHNKRQQPSRFNHHLETTSLETITGSSLDSTSKPSLPAGSRDTSPWADLEYHLKHNIDSLGGDSSLEEDLKVDEDGADDYEEDYDDVDDNGDDDNDDDDDDVDDDDDDDSSNENENEKFSVEENSIESGPSYRRKGTVAFTWRNLVTRNPHAGHRARPRLGSRNQDPTDAGHYHSKGEDHEHKLHQPSQPNHKLSYDIKHQKKPTERYGKNHRRISQVPYQSPVVVSISDNSFVSASPPFNVDSRQKLPEQERNSNDITESLRNELDFSQGTSKDIVTTSTTATTTSKDSLGPNAITDSYSSSANILNNRVETTETSSLFISDHNDGSGHHRKVHLFKPRAGNTFNYLHGDGLRSRSGPIDGLERHDNNIGVHLHPTSSRRDTESSLIAIMTTPPSAGFRVPDLTNIPSSFEPTAVRDSTEHSDESLNTVTANDVGVDSVDDNNDDDDGDEHEDENINLSDPEDDNSLPIDSFRLDHESKESRPVRYEHIIASPKNELPSYGRRYWHEPHKASIQLVQEEPNELHQGGINSAIIAILVGIGATGMLIMVVSIKMGTIRERVAYKGRRRSLVPDTDFLINTIPI